MFYGKLQACLIHHEQELATVTGPASKRSQQLLSCSASRTRGWRRRRVVDKRRSNLNQQRAVLKIQDHCA